MPRNLSLAAADIVTDVVGRVDAVCSLLSNSKNVFVDDIPYLADVFSTLIAPLRQLTENWSDDEETAP